MKRVLGAWMAVSIMACGGTQPRAAATEARGSATGGTQPRAAEALARGSATEGMQPGAAETEARDSVTEPMEIRPIEHDGPYHHKESGAVFPERVGTLPRTQLAVYHNDVRNVSASYGSIDDGFKLTGYIYPAGRAFNGRLREHFVAQFRGISEAHPVLELERATVVLLDDTSEVTGFEAHWRHSDAGRHDRLRLYQCGTWFLKLRITRWGSALARKAERVVQRLQSALSCANLAKASPAGAYDVVELDPDLEGTEGADLWAVYGTAMALRMQSVAARVRAHGVPDHDFELYQYALARVLEAYRHRGSKQPIPPFEQLARIQEVGLLDELIWSTHFAFLQPPHELELELTRYRAWKQQHLPGFEYRPRARIGVAAEN